VAKPDPNTTLELTRDFEAAPELVFGAFLDAKVLRTIWSSESFKIVEMTADARVGGGWKLAMRDDASGAVARCTARYAKIDRTKRIVWWVKWLDGPMADGRCAGSARYPRIQRHWRWHPLEADARILPRQPDPRSPRRGLGVRPGAVGQAAFRQAVELALRGELKKWSRPNECANFQCGKVEQGFRDFARARRAA
jgi:hypothetical protein